MPTAYETEDGETVHADSEVLVESGTMGFVRAFVDELPSPFDVDVDTLDELPTITKTVVPIDELRQSAMIVIENRA